LTRLSKIEIGNEPLSKLSFSSDWYSKTQIMQRPPLSFIQVQDTGNRRDKDIL